MAESLDRCEHPDCNRIAVRLVGPEAPSHWDFRGALHDCCGQHARPTKRRQVPSKEDLIARLLGDVARLKGKSLREVLVEYGIPVVPQ